MHQIHIAAALIIRPDGHTLLVRKAGTSAFMQPGGKIEPGESPVAALQRELHEEIGLIVSADACLPLGRFSAIAANEADATVIAETFVVHTDADVAPAREIAEIAWVDPADPGAFELAPLTRDEILPAWRRKQP